MSSSRTESSATKERILRRLFAQMDELDHQLIGQRVKRAREEAGLTQTQLGDLIGVTQRTIQNWEAIGPPIRELHQVEKFTKRSQRWLLYGDETDPNAELRAEVATLLTDVRRLIDRLDDGEMGSAGGT